MAIKVVETFSVACRVASTIVQSMSIHLDDTKWMEDVCDAHPALVARMQAFDFYSNSAFMFFARYKKLKLQKAAEQAAEQYPIVTVAKR